MRWDQGQSEGEVKCGLRAAATHQTRAEGHHLITESLLPRCLQLTCQLQDSASQPDSPRLGVCSWVVGVLD